MAGSDGWVGREGDAGCARQGCAFRRVGDGRHGLSIDVCYLGKESAQKGKHCAGQRTTWPPGHTFRRPPARHGPPALFRPLAHWCIA